MTEIRGTGGMMTQAEEGMKLFEAQLSGAAAEVDKDAAGKYKNDVEARIASLEAEAALLTGKDKKKERAAKGKEVAELKGEQQYVDACKVVKGLEPKFGYFVTKAAEAPKAPEKVEVTEEIKPEKAKKDSKKEVKKESAGLSPAETKELEDLKQQIIERKAILKEQGMSGGQQNKDEEIVRMVARMNDLKEKQDPGSTKKEKDDKKGSKKKTPLSAEEQKEFAQLQNDIELYKAKLRSEFGYSILGAARALSSNTMKAPDIQVPAPPPVMEVPPELPPTPLARTEVEEEPTMTSSVDSMKDIIGVPGALHA